MRNLNLCLHAGGHKATLAEIAAVKTPEPEGVWHPIAHHTLYEQVKLALSGMNMNIVNEQHALSHEGMRYFAMLQIGNGQQHSDDYAWVIGLRGSLDKTYAAGLACGSGVFVCDNLAFSGEITIARKYTTYIERDLPRLTANAVARLASKWVDMDKRFESYKQHELSEPQVHDLTIRALDLGALTTQQIPHVLGEWRKPRHEEFAAVPRTAYRYFNACTEILKGVNVFSLPKRTQNLHALLDCECGLVSSDRLHDITDGTVDAEVITN